MTPLRLLWHWFTLGPYHFARMAAVARIPGIKLTVVETTATDDHYWQRASSDYNFRLITLSDQPLSRMTHRKAAPRYLDCLHAERPGLIVESGYAEMNSLQTLFRYKKTQPGVQTLLWSETTSRDHKRSPIREAFKRVILSQFEGALVAGAPHAEYMRALGLPAGSIQTVGNCVDNRFFAEEVARRQGARVSCVPYDRPYFLYVGRFIPEKNLPFLIRSYARYRRNAGAKPHALVLVGSGPGEAALRDLVNELKVPDIFFAGSRQIHELPEFYASAKCFVLPSTSEPWGLVVNEAMASGLPVLASIACGCVPDLVIPGKTGYVFSPDDESALAGYMTRIATGDREAAEMGKAAQKQIGLMDVDRYAERVAQHLRKVVDQSISASPGGVRRYLVRQLAAAAALLD